MPVVRTDYAPGAEIPDCVQRDLNTTLAYPIYRDDAIVAPSAGTFTLRRPDGTILINARACSIVSDQAQVSLTASELANEPYQMGYIGEWTLTVAGQTRTFRNEVGLVRFAPLLPISDRNLTGRHQKIDTWLAGTGKTTWQSWIDLTWNECQRWLIQKGNRAHLIVQSSDLVDLMRVWTMKNILLDVISSQNGERFRDLFEDYKNQLDHMQSNLTFAYAPTDDTNPEPVRRASQPVTFLGTTGYWDWANRGYGWNPDPWDP
jgi:hypothetical protein